MNDHSKDSQTRYLREAAIVLAKEGFQSDEIHADRLCIQLDGSPLCEVTETGGVAYLAIRFSSFSTPIIALSAEKSEDVAQRKMPCRHSSNVTPFPAKQAFTTKSPQRKR